MATLKSFADLGNFGPKVVTPAEPPVTEYAHGPSWSSRIKDWLLSLPPNDSGDVQFTSSEIAENVKGASFGAVSGFMSKLVRSRVAMRHGKKDGAMVYSINLVRLRDMHVRRSSTRGSDPGRPKTIKRESTAYLPIIPATSRPDKPDYDLVSALLEAAAFAETVVPLQNYTTEQLIDEIHRRVHAGEK